MTALAHSGYLCKRIALFVLWRATRVAVLVMLFLGALPRASAQSVTVNSSSSVTFLDSGSSSTDFATPFTPANFVAAQTGTAASVTSPNPLYITSLPHGPNATWIGTNPTAGTGVGNTALYAASFNVPSGVSGASLTLYYALDNNLGYTNPGIYINGTALPNSTGLPASCINNVCAFNQEQVYTAANIAPLLVSETNWIYLDDVNLGGPAAIIFSATISYTISTTAVAATGYAVSDFATGFTNGGAGSVGPIGVAFDGSGNFFAMDYINGILYKFPPSGGVASTSTQVNSAATAIPGAPSGLAFTKDGGLYCARQTIGDVIQLDPTTGAILRVVAPAGTIPFATGIATDPLSGDLFVSSPGLPSDSVFRISNLANTPATVTVYASVSYPDGIGFGTDGSLYAAALGVGGVAKVSATNSATPGQVTYIPGATVASLDGLAISANPGAQFLYANGNNGIITKIDLSTNPPTLTSVVTGGTRGDFATVGPDGCLYPTQTDRVLKVTNADGSCVPPPLGPLTVSNPTTQTTVNQTFNTTGPTTSVFSGAQGFLVEQTIDATNAGTLTCNGPDGTVDCTGVQLNSTNMTVSNPPPVILAAAVNAAAPAANAPAFPSFVNGSPWSSALCAGRPGNGGSGDLCSLYVNGCYGGNSGVAVAAASDFYCPFINTSTNTTGYFVLQDTWDPLTPKPTITPGTTVSLLDFVPKSPSETWTGSAVAPNPVCTQVAPVPAMNGNPAIATQCDVSDSLVDVYGDQTTTRGTKPKKGWLISIFNVQMLLSTVQVVGGTGCSSPHSPLNDANPAHLTFESPTYAQNIWNNGTCLLGFTVNPAQTPNPDTNHFVAAPPKSLFFGVGAPPVAPGGAPEGDATLTNPNAVCAGAGLNCGAQPWQTGGLKTLSSIFGASDGTFILHYSAKDAGGTSEKSVVLINSGQCTTGPIGPVNAPCYSTTYFTTIVNLDSTKPLVSLTFSPAGGTYSVKQPATGIFACTDPPNNGVASGIATCTASVDGGAATSKSPVPLDTTAAGTHKVTVTAVDNAGNTTTQVFYYTVLPDADVAIFEQHTSDKVKPGGALTYLAWALDLSKTNAAEVTVTEQLQLPAAGVQLGNVTASVAIVTCTLSGCSSMPPSGGSNCPVSGTTITCNLGTLPSIWEFKGALIKTSIPVLNSSKVGTAFKIKATVNSPGDPIPGNNTTTDLLTICSPDEALQ
jgi:hypothetical protein